jgi:aryl-alcohol dehydrogenase-like predicted oxidoreductase
VLLLLLLRFHCASSFDNAEVYAKGQAEEIMGKAFKVRQQDW